MIRRGGSADASAFLVPYPVGCSSGACFRVAQNNRPIGLLARRLRTEKAILVLFEVDSTGGVKALQRIGTLAEPGQRAGLHASRDYLYRTA
jgi:hypothetical protein